MSTDIRRRYEWEVVVVLSLSIFLLGVAIARTSTDDSAFERFAIRLGSGFLFAIVGGAIVAVFKYYKRSPRLNPTDALAKALAYDMAIFVFSLVVTAFIVWKAISLDTYGAIFDSVIVCCLGFAVKNGFGPARWLMAIYIFITPFIAIAMGGGSSVIWPFVFYAACRSIMFHYYVHAAGHLRGEIARTPNSGTEAFGKSEMPVGDSQSGHVSTRHDPASDRQIAAGDHATAEDKYWEQALKELETGQRVKGTWARAFAEADGDESKAKAKYIQFRVERIKAELGWAQKESEGESTGIFGKLFGGSKEPKKPDDYYLASMIASTIDSFVSQNGLEDLINGDWSVELQRNYHISLTRVEGFLEGARAVVRLDELEEMADFKRIKTDNLMGDSPLGYMATDKLAMGVLRKMKEQLQV